MIPQWLSSKESACNAEAAGNSCLIPIWRRSPGGRHGNLLQYSCLENPMDRGGRQATVHRVTKSQTRVKQLNTCTHTYMYIYTHIVYIYVHLLYPFICQWTFNILKIFIYFIKLWGSWLWHAASSIFVASCGVFSCSMWDLVPWPRSELGFPCMGSVESSPLNCQASPNIKSLKNWK